MAVEVDRTSKSLLGKLIFLQIDIVEYGPIGIRG